MLVGDLRGSRVDARCARTGDRETGRGARICNARARFVTGNALAYLFVVGIAGLFVALLALECAMVARELAGKPSASAAAMSTRYRRQLRGPFRG